jgi:hypothetical protein
MFARVGSKASGPMVGAPLTCAPCVSREAPLRRREAQSQRKVEGKNQLLEENLRALFPFCRNALLPVAFQLVLMQP